MSPSNLKNLDTIPAGRLGLIPLESCASLGAHVNDWLVKWRSERREEEDSSLAFEGYRRDSYLIDVNTPALVPARQKESSMNLSAATTSILW